MTVAKHIPYEDLEAPPAARILKGGPGKPVTHKDLEDADAR